MAGRDGSPVPRARRFVHRVKFGPVVANTAAPPGRTRTAESIGGFYTDAEAAGNFPRRLFGSADYPAGESGCIVGDVKQGGHADGV